MCDCPQRTFLLVFLYRSPKLRTIFHKVGTLTSKTYFSFKRVAFVKVQIHDEIFSCNFGLMIQKFHEQLNFIVETLVRDMKH
jgi:hypothetical protein